MASTDATPLPIKGQALRITFGMWLTTGLINTGAAGLDSEVSLDGGTFADCTNEATEIATASGSYFLDLTAGEMNADTVAILVKSSTTNAITYKVTIYPSSLGKMQVDVRSLLGTAWLTPGTAGTPDVNVKLINGVSTSPVTTIKAVQGLAVDGVITTATNLTTNNDKTGYGLSSAAVQAIWDALTSALTTVGSIGKKLADWVIGTAQTGDSFARLGAPAGASVSADIAAVKVDTGALTHADGVETGISLLQSQRAMLATAVGPATGGNTSTIPFKNPGDTETRVTLNGLDANGNRTAPTLNL